MKHNKSKNSANRNILISTCIFLALFVAMIVYLVHFSITEGDEVINNPYNKRQEILAKKVIRGSLLSSDGSVLATTIMDDENEIRYYPNEELLSHVIGYTGNGGSGLENTAAYYMLTSNDNIWTRISNDITGEKDKGDNIITTLDLELSKVAYEALGSNIGSVVIMEPSTGKILTMVSTPDFNPNTIESEWSDIISDEQSSVLLNRATQGLYPPGSTFKIVTLLEYIRENPDTYMNYSYNCTGKYILGDNTISCSHGTAHGTQNLKESFANSCNGSFINMGLMLNRTRYHKTAKELLFNSKLPLNMEYKESSFVLNENSTDWETAQTAFGQGETLITPVHLAMICSAIANDGELMSPYLIDRIVSADNKQVKQFQSNSYGRLMTTEEAEYISNCMESVVDTSFAWLFGDSEYSVAGKSGTAQYGTEGYEHSLFMSYTPVEEPEIAVVVVLEGGKQQSAHAATVAKTIYDFYYTK